MMLVAFFYTLGAIAFYQDLRQKKTRAVGWDARAAEIVMTFFWPMFVVMALTD
jgi:hypothetical protein